MATKGTPTKNTLPLRAADFDTLVEALDYAAQGVTGFNFYNARGQLYCALPYAELRQRAVELARRLLGTGVERGDRLALIAETGPQFVIFFYACQYAGLVPVPMPAAVHLGGRQAFIKQIRAMLQSSTPRLAMAPPDFIDMLQEAATDLPIDMVAEADEFHALPESDLDLRLPSPSDLAYLQYTSGSTRFPRGVMITQQAVMSNLCGILRDGMAMNESDRCVSWLPYYHDMGLVGLVLACMASQRSVDYLGTRDFAMRPRVWLKIMSENGGTVSFSPPFGYELCARRLRDSDIEKLDLKAWRVAGVGAETIRPSSLRHFAEKLRPCGFDGRAFLPCYGMAETSLAISFGPLGEGFNIDYVDGDTLGQQRVAEAISNPDKAAGAGRHVSEFVRCGITLPDMEMEIRDDQGQPLGERQCGTIFVRGTSVMTGYFNDPQSTADVLSEDQWLNTGDLGYRVGNEVVITGRQKDLIIIKGRNIWPQDLEYVAERQSEVRPGDASAFSIPVEDNEQAVMVVQCRQADRALRQHLAENIRRDVQSEFGIDCLIELVPPHTLPRTSSGKLSRSGARRDFQQRHQAVDLKEQAIHDTVLSLAG
ncbi:MAG: fatty acyl-AMP ligase [Wenzhouxiangellaceae bacterium]